MGKASAGTEVTSDILFLQKRDRVADVEPDWIYLDTDENGITMNSYFVQHPEMVLGTMRMESSRFGMDSVCKGDSDRPLSELFAEVVQQINGRSQSQRTGLAKSRMSRTLLSLPTRMCAISPLPL